MCVNERLPLRVVPIAPITVFKTARKISKAMALIKAMAAPTKAMKAMKAKAAAMFVV